MSEPEETTGAAEAALYETKQLRLRAELLVMISDWRKYAVTYVDDLLPSNEIIFQVTDKIDKLLYETE